MILVTTESNTRMPTAKIAISLPEEVLAQIDSAARERGESRSGFIASVLKVALRARRGSEITRRLNALFADEQVTAEQLRITREMDAVGTDWSDETW